MRHHRKASCCAAQIWVEEVKLSAKNQPDVTISAYAWVNTVNSPRVFFTGKALLPSETPAGLKTLRDKELNIIKVRAIGVSWRGKPCRFSSQAISDPRWHTKRMRSAQGVF